MSHTLDRLMFFKKKTELFSGKHGVLTDEDRSWEEAYRNRWQHDKIVRSTHGVNCTGSCSWKIYVKGGIVTWETQQTDYPRTRPDLPDHEPRGCSRGASYSWYLYSANRVKYPLVRARLLRAWRAARKIMAPVAAWQSIQANPAKRADYVTVRGKGGFVRADWDEVNEIITAANAHTIKKWGPDRIFGFSPIPAMSMISYAAGARYLQLLGGVTGSFYDWYCDLPPASPQTWGEQTDVAESADWYNSGFLILWGSNVPQTRTPDAHFYTEARYKGVKSVVVCPDYSEASKFSDVWLAAKQGTDAALGMAFGHVILKEYHRDRKVPYFRDYIRKYSDLPLLVRLEAQEDGFAPGQLLRASDFVGSLKEENNPEWKTVGLDEKTGKIVVPNGSIGFRWGESGKWNLEEKDGRGEDVTLRLGLKGVEDDVVKARFPYFANTASNGFASTEHPDVLYRNVPVKKIKLADKSETLVTCVYDLLMANYGVDQGFGGNHLPKDYDDIEPYSPAWAEAITTVPREKIIAVARGFATNAEKTNGKSMIIIGAGMNHWYHMDMNYRAVINMLVMCGCIGQSGGGWSHYVGQEKLRPQTGWVPLAFATDWVRPPRQQNSTSFFYAHTDQWRYETVPVDEILSPTAPKGDWAGSFIDYNAKAERMGWLPSAPALKTNPIDITAKAKKAGLEPTDYVVKSLKDGNLEMSCMDPDDEHNWPRNMFVWRSNLLGSSGKGHEYFLKHFLGTDHGLQGKDLGETGGEKPLTVKWHKEAPKGKLDLLICIDFRMSTTAVYSDIVLPTATWYEKNDLNTSDMHPFIHPLGAAVDPAWESRSDWEIFKGLARKFSEVAPEVLGEEEDVVLTPIQHDSAGEIAQASGVNDWLSGDCDPISGKTMPQIKVVKRDYSQIYDKFTSLGPLMDTLGNGGKGIGWNTEEDVKDLADLNGRVARQGVAKDRPSIDTDIDACETILMLAPETNGEVAVKAWHALEKQTGREHAHLALPKEGEKIRFHDIVAQPRKIISSPTWSGIESEHVSYNASYTNVHELIPWRTLTGRQQLYQDHVWMRAFGEGLVVYKPPVDLKTTHVQGLKPNGNPEITLNFITPHQKWGIHSTYSDNLLMLTLNRGGPVVWVSETDARRAQLVDNDWVEVFNSNGALTARVVVSQRIREGTLFMYHAQEKIVNVPGSELTGLRGGIHNSVTRTILKPTHMIGGYAQLSYGFNYYGTVGSNRDEFIIIRKMDRVDWLDETATQMEAAE